MQQMQMIYTLLKKHFANMEYFVIKYSINVL